MEKLRGRPAHRYLTSECYRILRDKGLTNVSIEYKLPTNKIADVYGVVGEKEIVVECLVRPNLNIVKEKREIHKDYYLIISYPDNFVCNFPIEEFCDEVLKINIPTKMQIRNTMIQVEEDVWDWIRKNKKLGESHNEYLRRMLINHHHKTNRLNCGVCGSEFDESDLDMVNSVWLCRECEECRNGT